MQSGTNSGALVSVVAVCVTVAAAQGPTFRSGVDLVTVDATVLGRDGGPVEGLGPDDFLLAVDGQPRRVVSAQFVPQLAPSARPKVLPSYHFSSNEDPERGRTVMVAVDEAHIRRLEGRTALKAAATFIDTLDPADRIAVSGLTRLGVVDFTRDRAALKRRLETLVGQTDPVFLQFNIGLSEALQVADGSRSKLADLVLRECGASLTTYINPARAVDDAAGGRDACPEQVEQEARAMAQHARTLARISLSALEALVASLKEIEGPKTLVLLSEGLVADPRLIDFSELAAATHAARVSIYVLQMDVPLFEAAQDRVSPSFMQDIQVRGDGLARLAGAARGAMFRLVGSDPRPFERIARELSGYYLLGFEALESERDGRVHRIEIAIARTPNLEPRTPNLEPRTPNGEPRTPNGERRTANTNRELGTGSRELEIRARPAFRLPPVMTSARAREQELVDLLRASRAAKELPVRVATYTYVEPGSPHLRVVVSAEADAGTGSASPATLGFVLIDAKGVIAASGARQAETGTYAFSTLVAPGDYTLRVAAIDPLGRRGSLQRPFGALLTAFDGIRVSDLILAPVPLRPEQALEPLVDRVRDGRLMVYVELYADETRPLRDADVQIEVTGGDAGATLVTSPAEVVRRDARWAIARAIVSLAGLAPGRYTARAHISSGGRPLTRVARPFSIQ